MKQELENRGCQIRTGCAVQSVSKLDDGDGNYNSIYISLVVFCYNIYEKFIHFVWADCVITCEDGSEERYSGCIIATHAPDTLKMLGEQATHEEKTILGSFIYVYRYFIVSEIEYIYLLMYSLFNHIAWGHPN